MRLFTSIFCTLFLALSAFGQAIDYRALRTNQFSTNVPSRGYVGIIGYGVTNIPGTNVQFNSGTGITFTTNGASITITATGTNQVTITNVVLQAGTNIVVETNGPTSWTISGQPGLWRTNAVDGSITNINTASGTAYVSGTNGLLVLDNAASGKNILLTGETNGTPSFRLRSDGSMFLGKHVTNDVNVADFTTTYPLYFNGYTLSNDPVLASFKIGNQDQNGIPTFFSVISGGVLANKDTGSAIWTAQASTTNGLSRTWQIRAKPSLSQLAFATETNTAFKVDDKGDISIIKSVPYLWPLTNGGANQFLTTDGGNPQQLSWTSVATGAGSNSVAVAAGTNIFMVTNSGLVTISVANTNLPVVVAGTNVTVVTNGIAYTVSSTAVGGAASIGPGTVNQVAKFTSTTNVGDSIVSETATNQWEWRSRLSPNAWTNNITNAIYGRDSGAGSWDRLELVSASGLGNGYNELNGRTTLSAPNGNAPLKIFDTMIINHGVTSASGNPAGAVGPVQDNFSTFGTSSGRWKSIWVGPDGYRMTDAVDISTPNLTATTYSINLFSGGIEMFKNSFGFIGGFWRDPNLLGGMVLPAAGVIGAGSGNFVWDTFMKRGNEAHTWMFQTNNNSASAPPAAVLEGSEGTGTDGAGGVLRIASGRGTGDGIAPNLYFATPITNGGSGSGIQTLVDRMQINGTNGNVIIYSNLTVNGSFSAGSLVDPNALTNNDTRNITFTGSFSDTRNGVSTVIDSNTITTGSIVSSGSNTFTGTQDLETAAELRATNNAGTTGQVLTSAGSGKSPYWATATASGGGGTNSGPIALAYDGTIVTNVNIDASTPVGCVTNALLPYRFTLTTNALFKNPTGMLDGQRITIEFIQDATGSRIAYFDTKYAFGTDITGITLSTTASATDFATFIYHQNADKWRCVGFVRGY